MRFDLAFTLVDCAEPDAVSWYQAAAAMMLESARHAFQDHDVRYVQLTDEASRVAPGVDIRFPCAPKCDRSELAQFRGHCTAEWALTTDRPTILCDVDLLWNNDEILALFEVQGDLGSPDIAFFSRHGNGFQPFNGGLILTQPGQRRFWEAYRDMMKTLPVDVRPWWGDQIGLVVMTGTPDKGQNGAIRFGSKVAYIPIDVVAPSPKTEPSELLKTSAVHWKGGKKRKPWMPRYFERLQRNWHAAAAE
jgi:hypothetical protein